ncbi:MAG: hypothetical protein ABSE99_15225 [Terracidiphilus sp.]|jgi:hypothetical protein
MRPSARFSRFATLYSLIRAMENCGPAIARGPQLGYGALIGDPSCMELEAFKPIARNRCQIPQNSIRA